MNVQIETKAAVTVAEMARMLGMSRARFYQLQKAGVFPTPVYDVKNHRPIYVEEAQKVCLEVRRRNCGINGKPVLFYAKNNMRAPVPKAKKEKPKANHDLIDALSSLGLDSTAAQVNEAVREKFPKGTEGIDEAEVIRVVFVHLKRQNSTDNVRR
jgi:hypothetical protein